MSSVSVAGVPALRALAHPARLDLLDLLRVHGTLTAAECARLLGTSTKSCSYHLRVLAGQGLVTRADESADGRERPWRRAADERSGRRGRRRWTAVSRPTVFALPADTHPGVMWAAQAVASPVGRMIGGVMANLMTFLNPSVLVVDGALGSAARFVVDGLRPTRHDPADMKGHTP